MAIRDWLRRQQLRRLERRGDVVVRWSDEAQALFDLGEDLIPDPARGPSRDLCELLVDTWVAPGA